MTFKGMAFMAKLPDGIGEEVVRITARKIKKDSTEEIVQVFDYRIDMVNKFYGGRVADTNIYEIEPFVFFCDGSEYEISYEYDPAKFIPYDNKIVCNCDGVRRELGRFFDYVPSGNAYGMAFDVEYTCDDQYLLCALANSNQTLEYIISEAIRVATMYKFLINESIRAKVGTTVSNVLKINNYEEIIGIYSQAYAQAIEDISANYDTFKSELGCFICNPAQNIGRTHGIFVS